MKLLAEALHRVMQQGPHVAHAQSGGGSDIAIAEAGFEFQSDKFALPFGQ